MKRPADWLDPGFRIDRVGALMTTREGGASAAPFASMNVGLAVGDEHDVVQANRALLAEVMGAKSVFLEQVHGDRVVRIGAADAGAGSPVHMADASVTTETGIACIVQVADCLPVLLAARSGRAVGAAHAGWRGLQRGVVERAVECVARAAGCTPADVMAWLGPCIGPRRFEVGADVLEAFGVATGEASAPRFAATRPGKWHADLAGLARDRLHAVGVRAVSDAGVCTVEEPSRFFSFRRDGRTGRMAAAIWIIGNCVA